MAICLHPRHPVIFSDDDWAVQSPNRNAKNRMVPLLPFSHTKSKLFYLWFHLRDTHAA